jgi:DNA-binding CsgD family transcriptional regulator
MGGRWADALEVARAKRQIAALSAHLRKIYAELGVHSRVELAAAVGVVGLR